MTSRHSNPGFTLVELVIVVTIIGTLALIIAATFSVIVRTAPSTEARNDDARSLLGLTTWLPQDVMSTTENGFTFGAHTSSCGSTIPGQGLLELQWSEGTNTYRVDYRYVEQGGEHRIRRYACSDGGGASALNLTSDLPPIAGAPPVTIIPVNGSAPGEYLGLQFDVSIIDDDGSVRELLSLDAFTENRATALPPVPTDPGAPPPTTSPNAPPTATSYTYEVHQGAQVDLFVLATDPNNDALTASIVSGPTWATLIGPLVLRVSPSSTEVLGNYPVVLSVTDSRTPSTPATATITVSVVATTTSTSTTSTTTTTSTLPPCVAEISSVTPSATRNASNKGDPTDVGKLLDEVVVRITSNGFCGPLVLEFDPDPSKAGPNEFAEFRGAYAVTLSQNLLWRDSGGSPHVIQLKQGVASTTALDTATLAVA